MTRICDGTRERDTLATVRTTPAALHVPELADEPGLVHGFSTVALGSVGLKHASDREAVLESRKTFAAVLRSEEHTSELQSRRDLVCRLLLEKKKKQYVVLRFIQS